eukprot:5856193-Pyramimonas_sp.AAC.1
MHLAPAMRDASIQVGRPRLQLCCRTGSARRAKTASTRAREPMRRSSRFQFSVVHKNAGSLSRDDSIDALICELETVAWDI